MEIKPINIELSLAEQSELVKRTMKAKKSRLDKIESRLRELKRNDIEMNYLADFIGAEYINPEGKNHQAEVEQIELERQQLGYIITMLENRIMELENSGSQVKVVEPSVGGAELPNDRQHMWGS